jgi:hypothetical protein
MMRRLRVLLVVAALGFAWMAPVVAQAQEETSAWDWGALAERLAGWAEGVWGVVAGAAKTETPQGGGGDDDLLALDGVGEATTSDFDSSNPEAFPGYDPDG